MTLYIYHRSDRVPLLCKRWRRRFKGVLITETSYPPFKLGDVVINYGCSVTPYWSVSARVAKVPVLNNWDSIRGSANKLLSLQRLSDAGVPSLIWTTDMDRARNWDRVVCRHKLTGTGGEGIEIWDKAEGKELPDVRLYTKYYRKTHEYRVHVFKGKVIDFTQKKRMTTEKVDDRELERNKYVRNHANGWVFCREDVQHHPDIDQLALKATEVSKLDYAGVDILANFNKETGEYKDSLVCELNSAPGMVKTTYLRYVQTIKRLLI